MTTQILRENLKAEEERPLLILHTRLEKRAGPPDPSGQEVGKEEGTRFEEGTPSIQLHLQQMQMKETKTGVQWIGGSPLRSCAILTWKS